MPAALRTVGILKKYRADLLKEWTRSLVDGLRDDRRISEAELAAQANEFLTLMDTAAAGNGIDNLDGEQWSRVRDFLAGISRSRALQGFSSEQTATFIFSFKKPLFDRLRKELSKDPQGLADEIW